MHTSFMRENREVPPSPTADGVVGRIGKAGGRKPMMHDDGNSDGPILPTKPPNNARQLEAEVVEERGSAKGNTAKQNAHRTQSRVRAQSALDRVRQAARKDRKAKFTALFHHITEERLRDAFMQLRRKAAPGIDGVMWEQYAEDLDSKIKELNARLHRGAYRAKPSLRVYIPKTDGRLRSLGVASLEDKVVQRAVVDVMNAIYETDFLGFSYGFRPRRCQHDALDALYVGIARRKVNWVLDADIRGFFDAIDHEWLMKFVEHRVADRRILRLIRKWLNAGVMKDGHWTKSKEGTPQGATVSPLLANIFLHYVLDLWVQQWRSRHARGDVIFVRYCDDFVVGFQHYADAEEFREELSRRLRYFSLELHPDKTRLIEFGWYAAENRQRRGNGKPKTFDFLGFTHICGKSKSGGFYLLRHTMRQRLRAKLKDLKRQLRRRRHWPVAAQGKWLGAVVRGYFAYHAVPTNGRALAIFRHELERHWLHSLRRRGQRDRMNWQKMRRLSDRWTPKPAILHPFPSIRFDVRTRGRSRVR